MPTPQDSGVVDSGIPAPTEIKVSGKVQYYPGSIPTTGPVPEVTGFVARVEEPFKVATDNPLGVFFTQTLDVTGTFSAPSVPVELITLGLAVGIVEDGGMRLVRSATSIYDVAANDGRKPTADVINTKAYVLPIEFHNKLTAAIGEGAIKPLNTIDAGTLVQAGFILGKIVDSTGMPVMGQTIEPLGTTAAAKRLRVFYPNADFTGVGAATATHGIFVYVHNGEGVDTFKFKITGKPEYKERNAGAKFGAALILDVSPN
jgi:hypothetical protein